MFLTDFRTQKYTGGIISRVGIFLTVTPAGKEMYSYLPSYIISLSSHEIHTKSLHKLINKRFCININLVIKEMNNFVTKMKWK